MSDADVQEAYRQVYAGLRVLERHGERCVLLRRERLEAKTHRKGRTIFERCVEEGRLEMVDELLREADKEAERYGC